MRHLLMGSMHSGMTHGGMLHGGLGGVLLAHMLRRLLMKFVVIAVLGAAVVLWLRRRPSRQDQPWKP